MAEVWEVVDGAIQTVAIFSSKDLADDYVEREGRAIAPHDGHIYYTLHTHGPTVVDEKAHARA